MTQFLNNATPPPPLPVCLTGKSRSVSEVTCANVRKRVISSNKPSAVCVFASEKLSSLVVGVIDLLNQLNCARTRVKKFSLDPNLR